MLALLAAVSAPVLSLSARRAWIEMLHLAYLYNLHTVALRKESVDRNTPVQARSQSPVSRSPQGERG